MQKIALHICWGIFLILGISGKALCASITNFSYRVEVEHGLKEKFERSFSEKFFAAFPSRLEKIFSEEEIGNLHVEVIVTNEFQRDMIAQNKNGKSFLFISPVILFSSDLERILLHELFHLLHFKMKNEEGWVEEGLANFIPYLLLGKINHAEINTALSQSTVSLLDNFDLSLNQFELYGVTTLFFKYAFDHCGKEEFLKQVVHENESGERGISLVLQKINQSKKICRDFKSLASSFTLARVINERTFSVEEEFFILDSPSKLEINSFLAQHMKAFSAKDKKSFFEQFPRYLPLVLPLEMKDWLIKEKNKDQSLKIFAVSRSYPAKAWELIPGNSTAKDISAQFLVIFRE